MKKRMADWFRNSRAERIGIALLSLLFLALLGFRIFAHHWVGPSKADELAGEHLQAAYDVWRARYAGKDPAGNPEWVHSPATLFYFDPNTLDSAGFIRLGMPPAAVRGLVHWRSKGKHFYEPEDLKPLYHLPAEVYARIEPYIRIAQTQRSYGAYGKQRDFPAPKEIDLNTADSATLERYVVGIGPVLAHKIIARRQALGGFLNHAQLLEVYKFPDSTFQKFKQILHINPAAVQKINLRTATVTQLGSHPYIGEKMAKYIVLYREGIGGYTQLEQLRQVPLMNEEIYRKIAPYLTVGSRPQNGAETLSGAGPSQD